MPPRRSASAAPSEGVGGSASRTPRSSRKGNKSLAYSAADESSFVSSTSRRGDTSHYSLMNTSVNEANAIVAAQTGYSQSLAPPPNTFRAGNAFSPRAGSSSLARSVSPQSAGSGRSVDVMRSYVEENARATTPVTYFMQAPRSPDLSMEDEPSTSTHGNTSNETFDEGVWPDHVYDQMEQEVQRNRKHGSRRRKVREDAPWRPSESPHPEEDEDDSGIDGVGVVAGGGLAGRAATRGKTKERGEGYLGQGLGIRRRSARKPRTGDVDESGQHSEEDTYEEEHFVNDFRISPRPQQHYIIRETSELPVAREQRGPSLSQKVSDAFADRWDRSTPYMRRVLRTILRVVIVVSLLLAGYSLLSRLGKTLGGRTSTKHAPSQPSYSAPAALPDNFDEFNERFHKVEKSLGDVSHKFDEVEGISRTANVLAAKIERLEEKIAHLEAASHGHQSDMSKYGLIMDDVRSELADITRRVGGHDGAVGKIESEVERLSSRVSSVEAAVSDGRLRSALERILPDMLPVRNGKGKDGLVITPAFWLALKEVLVGKTELAAEVRKIINDGVPVPSSGRAPASTDVGEQLEKMVQDLFTRQASHLVEKTYFLDLLESELDGMRRELRTLQESWRKNQPAVAIKDRKGHDLTSEVQHLIDAALLRYSKDTIAKADYALFTAGASVIPSHTTDTLVISKVSKFFHLFAGQQDVLGNPPATALTPDNAVGNCWAFRGSNGSLGVQLSRKVVVSHITVEHLAKELALDTSSAPKDIEVWAGLEDGNPHADTVKQYLKDYPQEDTARPQSPTRFLLAKFAYDVTSESPIQTFPVRDALASRGIPVQYVVFQIDSNSGADYTCLYRVRVHGDPADESEANDEEGVTPSAEGSSAE